MNEENDWAVETMKMINNLTPNIEGKAFDVEWFLLREHLENARDKMNSLQTRVDELEMYFNFTR